MTYQEFKAALQEQMDNSTDAELVGMVEDLIGYTDELIALHYANTNPPPISNTGSTSRAVAGFEEVDLPKNPPPTSDNSSGSKAIG